MFRASLCMVCVTALAVAGCSSDDSSPGPADASSRVDSGSRDAGATPDTGPLADTGTTTPDTGVVDDGGTVMDDAGITEPDSGIALDAGIRVDAGPPECPPRTHPCECATGYYCLMIGAMCIAPTSPCPP